MKNLSERMYQRFNERRKIRVLIAILFVAISIPYLTWRVTILNEDAMVVSVIMLVGELIGFMIAVGAIFLSSNYSKPTRVPSQPDQRIDVFVTTFTEPYNVIRRTLVAAKNISYSHRTIILDDKGRPELKALAEQLGCTYWHREENTHAKAGNLNFGFSKSDADFFMVFDADHIAEPDALDYMLSYFDDPEVGLVQAPQSFYNDDSIQFIKGKNGELWHDQSFFYHLAMPNADTFGGPICVGTGVVYRASSLEEIGGIPTETVTEDLHTSLKLHKAGMKTRYHHESIAYGIGETDYEDFCRVRLRWGIGNVHALCMENILFCKGLNLKQRLNYLLVGLNHLEGWQYLIFYLIPIYTLLTGEAPFEISLLNTGLIITFPIVCYLLVQEFTCGFGRFWVNELYAMMRFPVMIRSTLGVFWRTSVWGKAKKQGRVAQKHSFILPQLGILAASVGTLIYSLVIHWGELDKGVILAIVQDPQVFSVLEFTAVDSGGFSWDLFIVAGSWVVFNVTRGVMFLSKVAQHAHQGDEEYAFRVPLEVETSDVYGNPKTALTERVSPKSLTFQGQIEGLGGESTVKASIKVPQGDLAVTLKKNEKGSGGESFDLLFDDDGDAQVLENAFFPVKWHREAYHSDANFMTPIGFFEWLIWEPRRLSEEALTVDTLHQSSAEIPAE